MRIEEVAAVVTGGASGLGAAAVAMLAARGASVAILDLNDRAATARPNIRFVRADVTNSSSVAAALDEAEQAHGIARILVNCAGIATVAKTVDRHGEPHSLDLFAQTIAVNLVGAFNATAKFAARLASVEPIDEERGVIINTASIAAFDGQIGQAAYAASKGGVVGMTLPIARDLASLQIRVVTIAPGIFLTPMLEGLPEPARESLGAQIPHPSRLGKPDEYAHLVEAIVTNPMLNGETIRLDGAIRLAPK